MKKGAMFFILLFLLSGCTALHTVATNPIGGSIPQGEEKNMYPVRYLKVCLLVEDESHVKRDLEVLKKGFESFQKKVGIGMGAVTIERFDPTGCTTQSKMYKKMFRTIIPKGPKFADLIVYFPRRLYVEDIGILLGVGGKAGGVEKIYRRFIIVRLPIPGIVEHELSHVFFATDGRYPEENRKIILLMKNRRKFDGWYIQNERSNNFMGRSYEDIKREWDGFDEFMRNLDKK